MKNPFHRHVWRTVAIDTGYTTITSETTNKRPHYVDFLKCKCGVRKFVITNDSKYSPSTDHHSGLKKAKVEWEEYNVLSLTNTSSVIYDNDYSVVLPGAEISKWKYKPVTQLDTMLKMIANNNEFKKLSTNKMVEDAFEQFVTTIALHKNL